MDSMWWMRRTLRLTEWVPCLTSRIRFHIRLTVGMVAARYVDRITRLVETRTMRASSAGHLGNECGRKRSVPDEYKRLKAYDPDRFVQFEQAWEDWNTDVVCPYIPTDEGYRNSGTTSCVVCHAQKQQHKEDLWGGDLTVLSGTSWTRDSRLAEDGRTYWTYNVGSGMVCGTCGPHYAPGRERQEPCVRHRLVIG